MDSWFRIAAGTVGPLCKRDEEVVLNSFYSGGFGLVSNLGSKNGTFSFLYILIATLLAMLLILLIAHLIFQGRGVIDTCDSIIDLKQCRILLIPNANTPNPFLLSVTPPLREDPALSTPTQ